MLPGFHMTAPDDLTVEFPLDLHIDRAGGGERKGLFGHRLEFRGRLGRFSRQRPETENDHQHEHDGTGHTKADLDQQRRVDRKGTGGGRGEVRPLGRGWRRLAFRGGRRGVSVRPRSVAKIDAPVNFAAFAAARAAFARSQGPVVREHLVAVESQIGRVVAQETADVNFRQADIEAVALELVQVLAADLRPLGCFADGNPFAFTGFFEALADGLHGSQLCNFAEDGKTDFADGSGKGAAPARQPRRIGHGSHSRSRSTRISRGCAPFSGPTIPFSSISSMRRAARL